MSFYLLLRPILRLRAVALALRACASRRACLCRRSFDLVAEISKHGFPRGLIGILLDAFRRRTVDHSHDSTALFAFRDDYFEWICRRTVNTADFRTHLDGIQNIDRERLADENRKN